MTSSEKEKDKNLKAQFQALVGRESEASQQTCKYEMHVDKQHAATNELENPACSSVPHAGEECGIAESSGLSAPAFWQAEALHPLASLVKTNEEGTDETVVADGSRASLAPFRFSAKPTLEDIRGLQAAFTAERGWEKYHQPQNLLLALVGEVGELAELFQWREAAPEGLPGWTASEREALSDELSDVLIYLVALANKCHVDLPSAALRKIEKNCLKYPAKLVYGSSKKYTEYQQ